MILHILSEIRIYHSSKLSQVEMKFLRTFFIKLSLFFFSSSFPSAFPPYLLTYLSYLLIHFYYTFTYLYSPNKISFIFPKGQKFLFPSIFVRTRLIRNDTRLTRLINQKSTDEQDYHYRYFNVPTSFIREKDKILEIF